MNEGIEHQEYISRNPNVPEKGRDMALEISQHYEKLVRRKCALRASRMQKAADQSRAKLLQLMGGENYKAFRHFVGEQRIDLRKILEPPNGPNVREDKLHDIKIKNVTKFLHERKIPVDSLRKIAGSFSKYFERVSLEEEKNASHIVPASEVPKNIRLHQTNPWTIFMPPYDGWQRGWNGWGIGYSVGFDYYLNTASGLVGNQVRLDNGSAGDADIAVAHYDTQVGFWYYATAAGLIETWIEAQSGDAEHYCLLEDEWGWSDSTTWQRNYLMMHVIHPDIGGPSFSQMSWWHGWGSPNRQLYIQEYLINGTTYWAHLFSDAPIPANTWVFIRCGTRSIGRSFTNDVEIHSKSTFKWFIKSVQVRTSG